MHEKRPPASWNLIARGWEKFTGFFNRGFDRLSHGYGSAAGFVIRHSAVMLLIYVALIGSAGWLLVTTPQGLHSGAGSRLCHYLGATAGRGLAGANHRDRSPDRKDRARHARHRSGGGVCRSVRRHANPGQQCGGAVPGVRGTGSAPEKGPVGGGDHGRSAQAAFGAGGRFHYRHSAALDSRHRHRRRLHHAHPGSPGPRSRIAGGGNRRTGRRGAQGAGADLGVFAVHREYAAGVRRYRSHQGAEARRADPECDRCDRDLFRLGLCQRFQYSRPHLSRHRAGRSAVPQGDRRSRPAAHPQCRRRHGDARQRGEFQRYLGTGSRRALQPLSGLRTAGRYAAGNQFGDRDRHHEAVGGANAAERIFLRLDRSVLSAGHRRQFGSLCISDLRAVRVPGAGRAVWQLEPAVRRHPDRADVPARRDHRRADHGAGRQHPDPDRLRGAGRARREERDPDRRVCPRHRARGPRLVWRRLSRPAGCGCGRS